MYLSTHNWVWKSPPKVSARNGKIFPCPIATSHPDSGESTRIDSPTTSLRNLRTLPSGSLENSVFCGIFAPTGGQSGRGLKIDPDHEPLKLQLPARVQ